MDIITLLIPENALILGTLFSILGSIYVYLLKKKRDLSIEAYENIYTLSKKIREGKYKENEIKNLNKLELDYRLNSLYENLTKMHLESNDKVHIKLLINIGLLYISFFNSSKEKSYLEKALEVLNSALEMINFKSDQVEYLIILMTLGELRLKFSEFQDKQKNLEIANRNFQKALEIVIKNPYLSESKEIFEYLKDTSILRQDNSSTPEKSTLHNLFDLIEFYIFYTNDLLKNKFITQGNYENITNNIGVKGNE